MRTLFDDIIPPYHVTYFNKKDKNDTLKIEFRDPQKILFLRFKLHIPLDIPESDVYVPILWAKDINGDPIYKFHYQHERGIKRNHRAFFELGHGNDWVETPKTYNKWENGTERIVSIDYINSNKTSTLQYFSFDPIKKVDSMETLDTADIQNPSPIKSIFIGQESYVWGYAPMFERDWDIFHFYAVDNLNELPKEEDPPEEEGLVFHLELVPKNWEKLLKEKKITFKIIGPEGS